MNKLHYLLAIIFIAIIAFSCVGDNLRDVPEKQDDERGVPKREPSEVRSRR